MKSLLNDELIDFLNESHNEYLAADKIRSLLLDDSFLELKENEVWNLKASQKYFLMRNSNSLIAFITPSIFESSNFYYKIISSHLDSPSLKLKENPAVSTNFSAKTPTTTKIVATTNTNKINNIMLAIKICFSLR